MAQFFTNETVSLEKSVDTTSMKRTSPESINKIYELERCINWIKSNEYKKVCLQFPDYMLPDAVEVTTTLQNSLGLVLYVMGDSAYESCCIDYVTAQHVDSDAIIHFGPRCLSKWTEVIPSLCIYDKSVLQVDEFAQTLSEEFLDKTINLVIDKPYLHLEEEIKKAVGKNVSLGQNEGMEGIPNIYLGENNRNLMNFQLCKKLEVLYVYDPREKNCLLKPYNSTNAILKRRNYLIEKVKDSKTVGIVIGTLVLENFLRAVIRIKTLLRLHSKKYYTLSVGRPTVAKLANFPEMDVYVLVCCPWSNVFDSREFYKPIVTLYDVEIALNPNAPKLSFSYDIDVKLLDAEVGESVIPTPDVSLLTGEIRYDEESADDVDNKETQLIPKDRGTIALNKRSGAGFLSTRVFKGLEQNVGKSEVKLAEEGRKGIAQSYDNELF